MSILDDLAKSIQQSDTENPRKYCENGQLSIANDIFKMQMDDLGIAADIINDVMLEPVDSRDDWILYFRINRDNKPGF